MSTRTTVRTERHTAEPSASRVVFQLAWLGGAALAVSGLVVLSVSQQVPVGDALLYLGYFAGFAAVPGILLASVLDRRPLGLGHVCVGIPLGLFQSMVALMAFATVGLRGAAPWATLVVTAACLVILVRRRAVAGAVVERHFRPEPFAVAAIALVSVSLMASRDFPQHPLPSRIGAGASYYNDLAWHIGNAVTLKRDWPPRDLRAAGLRFRYYIGDYLQAAQTSVATGVEPATIVLRLDPTLQLVILALQLFWLGRLVGRRARTGLLAASLVLLVGDLSILHPATTGLFANLFLDDMYLSPTYMLGLVFFVPLLGVTAKWLRTGGKAELGALAVLALLMLGSGLTKTMTVAIMLLVGGGLCGAELVRRRRLYRPGVRLAGVAALAYVVLYPIVHRRGEESTLTINPLGSLRDTQAWHLYRDAWWDVLPLHALVAVVVILATAPALIAGLVALRVVRRAPFDEAERMLAYVAAVGVGVLLVFVDTRGGQYYFWFYGYVALAVLAAVGIDALLTLRGGAIRGAALVGVAVLAVLGVGSVVLQAGPAARRVAAKVAPGVPGPFQDVRPSHPDLTQSVVSGLLWLRGHSKPHDVVAVNNVSNLAYPSYRYFNYSALSERQILLEGFDFTPAFFLAPTPASARELRRRLDLMKLIYRDGSADAIAEARRRYDVDYLLVDRRDDLPHHALPASAARLVFSDRDVQIYSIAPR